MAEWLRRRTSDLLEAIHAVSNPGMGNFFFYFFIYDDDGGTTRSGAGKREARPSTYINTRSQINCLDIWIFFIDFAMSLSFPDDLSIRSWLCSTKEPHWLIFD